MIAYQTPGIYRRIAPPPEERVAAVRTDVAGFVGFAERGPLPAPGADTKGVAVRLTSWSEFLATFGGEVPHGYLAYAVRAFFENGGTTCWVVRAAATHHEDPLERPVAAAIALPTGDAPVPIAKLRARVSGGQTDLALDGEAPAAGDLVAILGPGLTEVAMVAGRIAGGVRLARRLDNTHEAGETVARIPCAAVVTALSRGSWGNRIRLGITLLPKGEFSLRVSVDPYADPTRAREEELYRRLSLSPDSDVYAPLVVNGSSRLVSIDPLGPTTVAAPKALLRLQGGRDGLRGLRVVDLTGSPADLRGLRLLEDVDEVSILTVPDAVFAAPPVLRALPKPRIDRCAPPLPVPPPDPVAEDPTAVPPALDPVSIQRPMIDQCERLRDRVAIVDPPDGLSTLGVAAFRSAFATRFAALYHPWLLVPNPLTPGGPPRRVPPSGHIAGVYARTDHRLGVHHSPANAALDLVIDVASDVRPRDQEILNPIGVNALRAFPGRGILVWGARSLAGPDDTAFRFIHVRRLLSMIEESVDDSMQWAVFEPNDDALRRTLTHAVSVFLEAIRQGGGLAGSTPEEAYFVKCDASNNPPAVTDAGRIVCQVGVAMTAPIEFLVFEIRKTTGGAEIVDP